MTTSLGLARQKLTSRTGYCLVSMAMVAIIFFLVLLTLLRHPSMIAPEAALNLEAAKLIATGKVPYQDFLCFASPIIIYGSLVPLLTAQVLNIAPSLVMNLTIWLVALSSTLACAKILLSRTHHREWHIFPPIIIALALANVLMLFQLGQNEHLFMLLFMPYLLVRWLRWNDYHISKTEAIASGILAGIGASLCEIYIVFLILLECQWLGTIVKIGPLVAPEARTCLITMLAYGLFLIMSPAPFTAAYLSTVVPIFAAIPDYYDMAMYGLDSVPERRDIFYAGIAAILFAVPKTNRSSLSLILMLLFFISFWFYLNQPTGLTHSAIPMIFSATLLWAVNLGVLGATIHRLKLLKRRRRALERLNFCLLCTFSAILIALTNTFLQHQSSKIATAFPVVTDKTPGENVVPADCASWVAKYSNKGDQLMFLTDDVLPGYPLILQMNRQPSGYLLESTFLPYLDHALHPGENERKYSRLCEKLYNRLKQDIIGQKAKMIFIQDAAIRDLLVKNEVMPTIEKYYEYRGGARLKKIDEIDQEPLEYHGAQYNIAVFLPRKTPL
ncbi:hypothetical protein KBI23_10855 [bacterium]|nr:hypothetical protein [bacterium]MBP9810274.1 hypothetical protein [bacterium]